MVDILLTNDDGHRSAGFVPLLSALSEKYDVLSVTPDSEKSWIGKAVTPVKELRVRKVRKYGREIYTVSGTPADCVQLGLYHIAAERPKLIVAGINLGSNASVPRILSSGTVGAGMEGAMAGVRAICVSLDVPKEVALKTDLFSPKAYPMFTTSVRVTMKVVEMVFDKNFAPEFDLLSVNIPFNAQINSKLEVTRPDTLSYGQLFTRSKNGFIHDEKTQDHKKFGKGTDLHALERGNISVTPISLALTTNEALRSARRMIAKN